MRHKNTPNVVDPAVSPVPCALSTPAPEDTFVRMMKNPVYATYAGVYGLTDMQSRSLYGLADMARRQAELALSASMPSDKSALSIREQALAAELAFTRESILHLTRQLEERDLRLTTLERSLAQSGSRAAKGDSKDRKRSRVSRAQS